MVDDLILLNISEKNNYSYPLSSNIDLINNFIQFIEIDKELKKKVIMTIVWRVALYGLEIWTLRNYERDGLEAFEM